MYFGYNQSQQHSITLPSQSMTMGINASMINRSVLLEPQVVTLQRESENYIRLVEQEKKHYFSVDETWYLVKKEWSDMRTKLEEIAKIKQSPEQKLQHSKVKNLENGLEQAICKFNELQAINNQLERQINSQRKDRQQFLSIYQNLNDEIKSKDQEYSHLEQLKGSSEKRMQKSKDQIAQLKRKNDTENQVYVSQFEKLQKEVLIINDNKEKVLDEKRQRDVNKLVARKEKTEIIDTATLLKMRLKRIIANNKEKVKVIEHYLKNMRVIDEAFTQIKEATGISDIEEIQNTFIKSEEQNYSLYNYVDILQQEIDKLTEGCENLKAKIQQQEYDNDQRIIQQKSTPPAEKQRRRNEQLISKRVSDIDVLRTRMEEIGPDLQNVLVQLSKTTMGTNQTKYDYELVFNLSESSLEGCLQDFEYYINMLVTKQQIVANESVVNTTLLLDQIPQKDFNIQHLGQINILQEDLQVDTYKLMDKNKLRQVAIETLEKKKKN